MIRSSLWILLIHVVFPIPIHKAAKKTGNSTDINQVGKINASSRCVKKFKQEKCLKRQLYQVNYHPLQIDDIHGHHYTPLGCGCGNGYYHHGVHRNYEPFDECYHHHHHGHHMHNHHINHCANHHHYIHNLITVDHHHYHHYHHCHHCEPHCGCHGYGDHTQLSEHGYYHPLSADHPGVGNDYLQHQQLSDYLYNYYNGHSPCCDDHGLHHFEHYGRLHRGGPGVQHCCGHPGYGYTHDYPHHFHDSPGCYNDHYIHYDTDCGSPHDGQCHHHGLPDGYPDTICHIPQWNEGDPYPNSYPYLPERSQPC